MAPGSGLRARALRAHHGRPASRPLQPDRAGTPANQRGPSGGAGERVREPAAIRTQRRLRALPPQPATGCTAGGSGRRRCAVRAGRGRPLPRRGKQPHPGCPPAIPAGGAVRTAQAGPFQWRGHRGGAAARADPPQPHAAGRKRLAAAHDPQARCPRPGVARAGDRLPHPAGGRRPGHELTQPLPGCGPAPAGRGASPGSASGCGGRDPARAGCGTAGGPRGTAAGAGRAGGRLCRSGVCAHAAAQGPAHGPHPASRRRPLRPQPPDRPRFSDEPSPDRCHRRPRRSRQKHGDPRLCRAAGADLSRHRRHVPGRDLAGAAERCGSCRSRRGCSVAG